MSFRMGLVKLGGTRKDPKPSLWMVTVTAGTNFHPIERLNNHETHKTLGLFGNFGELLPLIVRYEY